MSDAITSTKLEPTGKIFWDSRSCLCAWGSAFLSPAHEREMRGYLVYVLIVKKIISLILFTVYSHSMLDWTVFVKFCGDFLKHF